MSTTIKPKVGSHEYKAILAGVQMPVVTEQVTVKQNSKVLPAGAVIALQNSDKKAVLVNQAGSSDGTNKPYGVLLEAVDAVAGDVVTVCATCGEFVEDNLTFGASTKADQVRDAARERGIVFRKSCNPKSA